MSPMPTPGLPRISGCTVFRLRKLTRRVTQHYDACLAPTGLRVTQFSLLSTLIHNPPQTMLELAQKMEMDRTTLTRNLKPLAAVKYVETAAGPDARTRVVAVTEAGRAAWSAARPLWRRAQDGVNAALGLEAVGELHAVLDDSLARFTGAAQASVRLREAAP